MSKSLQVVLNGKSGTALDEEGLERLRKAFAEAGCEAHIERAASGEDLRRLVERAAARHPDAVVVGGGDGTISTAANALVDTGVPLAVLPLGTLNHFAKDLHIPLALEDAVRVVAAGRTERVDVGEVNGRVFINNSSLGLYPSIVRRREQIREERPLARGKSTALIWATMTALRRAPFLDVELCLDGRTRRLRTPFVFVGNNAYTLEGLAAGTREGLQDGELSVHSTTRQDRLGLVTLALRALFRRLDQAHEFQSAAVQSLDVRSRHKRLLVSADGEVEAMETPLHYRIRPRALTVIVPLEEEKREEKAA